MTIALSIDKSITDYNTHITQTINMIFEVDFHKLSKLLDTAVKDRTRLTDHNLIAISFDFIAESRTCWMPTPGTWSS